MKTLILLLHLTYTTGTPKADIIKSTLIEVNPEWNNHEISPQLLEQGFVPQSENEKVQLHLKLAELYLREKNVNHPEKLKILDELASYRKTGLFPVNSKYKERRPCFIDEFDTRCAVGHLMFTTGDSILARTIAKNEQYDFIQEITTEGVTGWMEKTGFTLEELALIQPGYDAPLPKPTCGKETLRREYYASDSLHYIGECKNGVLDGKWEVYNTYNLLRESGNFKNGLRQGQWVRYSYYPIYELMMDTVYRVPKNFKPSPNTKEISYYVNDTLEGEYRLTDGSGKHEMISGTYKKGNKVGTWTYHSNGWDYDEAVEQFTFLDSCQCYSYYKFSRFENYISKGFLKNDSKIGRWEKTDTNGVIKNIQYYETGNRITDDLDNYDGWYATTLRGYRTGTWIEKHTSRKNGITSENITNYKDDKYHGSFRWRKHGNKEDPDFFDRGIIVYRYGNFKEGKFDGNYYEIKEGDTILTGQYENGLKSGVWKKLENKKTVESFEWKNDTLNGQSIKYIYASNKVIRTETQFYSSNKLHGYFAIKDENGYVVESGHYSDGKKHGRFESRNELGVLTNANTYEFGEITGLFYYNSEGKEETAYLHNPNDFRPEMEKLILKHRLTNFPSADSWVRLNRHYDAKTQQTRYVIFDNEGTFEFTLNAKGQLVK